MLAIHKPIHQLTTGDVARMLGCAPRTAAKYLDRGLIKAWRLPGSSDRRTTVAAVYEFARAHEIPLDEIMQNRAATLDSLGMPKPRGLRSHHWANVATAHLAEQGACAACGASDRRLLNVHHIRPFHLFPHLELEPSNLITLCESRSHNCHLMFGHLLNWQSWNEGVIHDAAAYLSKVLHRPAPHHPPAAHAAAA